MSENRTINVSIPVDKNGMVGRECSNCKKYFKLKPGTGLPTRYCNCPYCDHGGSSETFRTNAQVDYAVSIAKSKLLSNFTNSLKHILKDFESSTKNSIIEFNLNLNGAQLTVPVKYYSEKELETNLTCDNCGLVFSVYGVFAKCPDCNKLNSFLMYDKSLESIKKHFAITVKPDFPEDLKEKILSLILTDCVSSFDGLGKDLIKRFPNFFRGRTKSLFQNLIKLNEVLNNLIRINHSDYEFLLKMFQVRHIYQHNMGVIDTDFINKVQGFDKMVGRKYRLTEDEVLLFINSMNELGKILKIHFDEIEWLQSVEI